MRGGTSPAKFNQALCEGRSTTSHRQNRQHRARDSCSRCGKCPGQDPAVCPAKDKICNFCHKRGHFRAVCRSAAHVQQVQTSPEGLTEAFLGTVQEGTEGAQWSMELTLKGKSVSLQLDTGAEVTVISQQMWRDIGRPGADLGLTVGGGGGGG